MVAIPCRFDPDYRHHEKASSYDEAFLPSEGGVFMKKLIFAALFLSLVLFGCDGDAVQTAETAKTTVISTEIIIETMIETTAETTTETTTAETTTEATTEATTETTTVTTTSPVTAAPLPDKPKSAHVQTVLDGEYTYNDGSTPIIETVDGFTYVNGILIANKTYSLPEDFDPGELHPDAKPHLKKCAQRRLRKG